MKGGSLLLKAAGLGLSHQIQKELCLCCGSLEEGMEEQIAKAD